MKRIAAALLLLCAVPAGAGISDAPSVAAAVEALENPTLGPSSSVQDLTVTLSPNMTVVLESGSAAPVMAAGEQIGLFFQGKGTLTYRSVDKTEWVNVKNAVRRSSDLNASESDGAMVIKGPFEEMFLRSAAIALPKLSGSGGSDLGGTFAKHRESIARVRWDASNHLLVKQKFDSPASPLAMAHFAGKGVPSFYLLDTVEDRSEALVAMTRQHGIPNRELASYFWPVTLSDQPVGRSRKDFVEPSYLLTDIDYTLVGDNEENGKLDMTETITPRRQPQRVYLFALYSNDFDSKFRARPYNLRKVTDAAGKELSYHHSKGSLIVGLPKAAGVNEPFKLRFQIDGNFLYKPAGDARWQLGTEPWFPQPGLNGQYYTIHSVVKVQKPFVAFAPGVTVRKGEEGDYNVIENRVEKPVQFAVVHAGKYIVDEKTYDDGLTIRVASYALPKESEMKRLNNLAWKMIKFYEPWLGPFPFKEFNIIEINELGWGQAPPGTMFITKEAFNPLMGEDNKLFSQGINHRFAHEIAHQYWGHVVKMGSIEEQWVTEAFAEYSSSLAIKQLKGNNGYQAMLARWRTGGNEAREVSSIALANRSPQHRFDLIYNKGAYLLAVLHKEMGDDQFLTFLRSLQGFFQWKYLTTSDMTRLLQRITGKDYTGFFDQHYWGTGMPAMPK